MKSFEAAPAKQDKTLLEKMRTAVDRTPRALKVLAQAAAFGLTEMSGSGLSDKVDAAEDLLSKNREDMVQLAETRPETKAEMSAERQAVMERTAEIEGLLKEATANNAESIRLDLPDGFSGLSQRAIDRIAKSRMKYAQLNSGPENFPNGEQLGSLAKSEKCVVLLNNQAYDANLGTYPWLQLATKIKPDRELENILKQQQG